MRTLRATAGIPGPVGAPACRLPPHLRRAAPPLRWSPQPCGAPARFFSPPPRLRASSSASGGGERSGLDFVCFTVIVDDLVLPDGTTVMEVLGGGGPQSLWGYRVAAGEGSKGRVGLAAGVGADLPPACVRWLEGAGVDTDGLLERPTPTPRAWQIQEYDGRRTQVWRTEPTDELLAMLRPPVGDLPPKYRDAGAYHVGVHPQFPDLGLLGDLRALLSARGGGLLSVEPFTHALDAVSRETLEGLVRAGDVFSPNELEAATLVGEGSPEELIERLVGAGARVVCLRRGPDGLMVYDAESGEGWDVPVAPGVEVVDTTGCGNACCGGFLAALQAGLGIKEAGVWGCVSGSLMAEVEGVPAEAPEGARERAAARAGEIRSRARPLSLPGPGKEGPGA